MSSMTTNAVFVFALAILALGLSMAALSIWAARRRPLMSNGQLKVSNDQFIIEIAAQKAIVSSLQRQASDLWQRLELQETELAGLRAKSTETEQRSVEQNALIRALQRQLGGWAQDSNTASKRLRKTLTESLNEDELRQWAADLKIPFTSLRGETLPVLIISMLDFLERYGRMSEGLAELHATRPDIKMDQ